MVLPHSEKGHAPILCLLALKCPVHFTGTHKVTVQESTAALRIYSSCVIFGTSWMDEQAMKDVMPAEFMSILAQNFTMTTSRNIIKTHKDVELCICNILVHTYSWPYCYEFIFTSHRQEL